MFVFIARSMFNIPTNLDVSQERRKLAKKITYSILYGSYPKAIAMEVGCSIKEAQDAILSFNRKFPRYVSPRLVFFLFFISHTKTTAAEYKRFSTTKSALHAITSMSRPFLV